MPFLGKTPTKLLDANVNIDGGNIDGTTIGSSSAAAGTFTNLTATGTLTLPDDGISGDDINGGTISNFASTGIDDNATSTAITIDSSENVAIGLPSAVARLEAQGSGTTSSTYSFITRDGNGTARFYVKDDGVSVFAGNVGIGETSPAQALVVHRSSGSTYLDISRATQSQGQVSLQLKGGTGGTSWIMYQEQSSDDLRFYGNGSNRMIITSSGNVGIGTTSPGRLLEVYSDSAQADLAITASTTGQSFLAFADTADSNVGAIAYDHATNHMRFRVNDAERMRIDSSGNVGIGTASPSEELHVIGDILASGYLRVANTQQGGIFDVNGNNGLTVSGGSAATANTIIAYTGGSERMRIDTSGNLLVGRTNVNYGFGTSGAFILSAGQIQTEVSGACLFLNNTNGTGTATIISLSRGNSGAGGIASSAGGTPSFVSASDAKLKHNIQDHSSELNNVMGIKTRVWEWKDKAKGSGEGVVAQELEQTAWADLVFEGDDGYKMVSGLGVVETRLIKALQEAVTRIETLEAEVAALKGA